MRIIILICFLVFPAILLASEPQGLGEVAGNLLEPVNIVADFVATASIIIGVTLLFAALLKYLQHRINPHASPISTIVLLIILGILLILLPFAYKLAENGVSYTFFS